MVLSFLGTNEELLLVHEDMPYISRAKRYDLMLTPQFYIFKKEPLPVSYQYQAARLAPAILDELTGGGNYSYAAIKEDEGWILIAYDMLKIESFLEEKGLSKNLINKIYFVQQAKEYFTNPVSVNEKNALVTIDDTVVVLPKSIVDAEKYGTYADVTRPERGLTPSRSQNSWVSQKQAIIVSVLLFLLATGYTAEALRYQNAIASMEKKIETVKQRYPELKNKSTIVLSNLYESAYAVDSLQRRIRDRLKEISGLTSKVSKIDMLKIDTKQYEVTISTAKQHITELKEYARSQNLKVRDTNSSLKLKGAL